MKKAKVCKNGHTFYKSSDCPTCPICEKEKPVAPGFLSLLGSPARNSLLNNGVDTIEKLAAHTEKEILQLHGIGKGSMPAFHKALSAEGMTFKEEQ
ncbi:MAG: hypothetical protein EOP49_19520 [Sphingobacteriales bacterium]|nr:MAG: hypothetical protein EOP49_19520 [Sphingobacteriales bacterium]